MHTRTEAEALKTKLLSIFTMICSFQHLTLAFVVFAIAVNARGHLEELYHFREPTDWIENIAVRPNGQLLLTTYNDGRLYSLEPHAKNAVPKLVAQLPHATALTGIVEIAPDIFAFAGGVFNITDYSFEHSSGQIALVNFAKCGENGAVSVNTVAKVPGAKLLNGLVALPEHPDTVLSSDSKTGTIYRVDTVTGFVDVAFQDDRLAPSPDSKLIPLGVNGLKIHKGYLYLTNSGRLFFARIKITNDGDRAGDIEMVTELPSNPPLVPDDFAIAKDGTAYIAAHPDVVAMITPNGTLSILAGGQSEVTLDTPTSVALSRDERTVFVVTGGSAEVNGTGGQLVAISL